MPKRKKPKTIAVRDPEQVKRIRRAVFHLLGVVGFVGLLAVGYRAMRDYVERDIVYPQRPPHVVLKNRPVWMSDARAMQIIKSVQPTGLHSAFDRQLLADTADILRNNPWVKQVIEIRRSYEQTPADTLEIDCDYRAPIALVHWENYFWLVDGEGIKLPEQFTAQQLPAIVMGPDRRLNIRIIDGVSKPPVESGQKWPGDDLVAGLDLVKILYGLNYADEIIEVNVRNFGGRIDPKEAQLSLITRYGTQVHWGRPINAKDFFVEIPTAQKLKFLQEVYTERHRVDGGFPWIDIRFDKITFPTQASADGADPHAAAVSPLAAQFDQTMTLHPATIRGKNAETISDGVRIAPMIVWLLMQVLALLLAAARVPIWARFESPIETWAFCWMLSMQIGAASLLFPWLMSDLRAGVSVTLISLPFILLAGLLARTSMPVTLQGCAAVGLWLSGLAAWSIVLNDHKAQLVAATIASLATIGAAGLIYLAIEFNDATISFEKLCIWTWIALGANFLAAVIAAILRRRLRAKLSTG